MRFERTSFFVYCVGFTFVTNLWYSRLVFAAALWFEYYAGYVRALTREATTKYFVVTDKFA
jgi:hypothetical protein